MARQLVLCCDGTNNNLSGRAEDTHVLRLVELLALDPDAERLVFYDPGADHAATLPASTAWQRGRQWRSRLAGLAFGKGLFENVLATYGFLMRHWRPGDQIFLFGFSRGGFTARSVAGMVSQFGLLDAHQDSLRATLTQLYFADRQRTQFRQIVRQAQELFVAPERRRVDVQFVGCWDTVDSIGLWPFALRFAERPVAAGKAVLHVRQALALDEHRALFAPRLYQDPNGPLRVRDGRTGTLEQRWFCGAHADVGGGYTHAEAATADPALAWMLSQAAQSGLRLQVQGETLEDEARALALVRTGPRSVIQLHCELAQTPLWALTGQSVRQVDAGTEHPSVAVHAATRWPRHTAWRHAPPPRSFWIGWLLLLFADLWMGQLISGRRINSLAHAELWPQLLQASSDFALSQLTFNRIGAPYVPAEVQLTALGVDLLFIVGYVLVLSPLCARGFARLAGWRRASSPRKRWLNALGQALPVLVFADLAENLSHALALALQDGSLAWLSPWLRGLTALASAVKFVGLGGCLMLTMRAWL